MHHVVISRLPGPTCHQPVQLRTQSLVASWHLTFGSISWLLIPALPLSPLVPGTEHAAKTLLFDLAQWCRHRSPCLWADLTQAQPRWWAALLTEDQQTRLRARGRTDLDGLVHWTQGALDECY
ncbi:PREDICTED: uncharacterized protein LOC101363353 [Odobenus rosmarus divergens]|uniref:Uncharacterized protein LOC101363353 n=1 Tax=Odobenus rosmarus divergens TaxID=9708 RepID=A0A9B0H1K4_ODORO